MRPLHQCCLLFLTVMLTSCSRPARSTNCPHDPSLRTYSQWERSVSFPYIAPKSRTEQIANNIGSVGVGSNMQEFIAALGEPDFEEEATPKVPVRPCKEYVFTYYFEKIDAEVTNEVRDKRIKIFFSRSH